MSIMFYIQLTLCLASFALSVSVLFLSKNKHERISRGWYCSSCGWFVALIELISSYGHQ